MQEINGMMPQGALSLMSCDYENILSLIIVLDTEEEENPRHHDKTMIFLTGRYPNDASKCLETRSVLQLYCLVRKEVTRKYGMISFL